MEKILSFQQKIDIILKIKQLNIKDIEKSLQIDGTFYKAYNENREPREKLLMEFLRKFHVKESWWRRPLGVQENDIFEKNGTYVEIPNTGDNNMKTPRETFYLDLIEHNMEYSLIPRAVLKDYKIVPDKIIDVIIQSNENEKKALQAAMDQAKNSLIEKYELIIEGKENRIKSLLQDIENLKLQIPTQNKQ